LMDKLKLSNTELILDGTSLRIIDRKKFNRMLVVVTGILLLGYVIYRLYLNNFIVERSNYFFWFYFALVIIPIIQALLMNTKSVFSISEIEHFEFKKNVFGLVHCSLIYNQGSKRRISIFLNERDRLVKF